MHYFNEIYEIRMEYKILSLFNLIFFNKGLFQFLEVLFP
jgi:hypothetical protein